MLELYFSRRGAEFYSGKNLKDMKKEYSYQTGITPEKIEKAKNHCSRFAHYDDNNKPLSECPPIHDSKWRFFWHMNEKIEN